MAVLAVVLYHFGLPGFGGGFVGVDVFFVISGFLMTQIIAGKLATSRFSLAGFYAGRVRRILPALLALAGLLLVVGYFWLIPSDYKLLGHHAYVALTFTSNILFSHKSGYFERGQREQWLLHTWSLSVESQFYLVYPLFLMGLKRYRHGRFLKHGVSALFILSLLASIAATSMYPNESFYLLPTRMWEFIAGGLSFFFPLPRPKNGEPYLAWAGLACILGATVFYAGDFAYPGGWAVLPVLGTVLAIKARGQNILLTNRVAQFFGDISYSLYLWHWPVFLGGKYFGLGFTPPQTAALLALATVLAVGSYRFVETPFRHAAKKTSQKKPSEARFLTVSLGGCVILASVGLLVYKTEGLPARAEAGVLAADQETNDTTPRQGDCMADDTGVSPGCVLGAKTVPSAALWGDSHADMLFNVLNEALNKSKRSAMFYSHSGCPPVADAVYAANSVHFGRHWHFDQCQVFNRDALDKIVSNPHIRDVFLAASWSGYLTGIDKVVFEEGDWADDANLPLRTRLYTAKMAQTMCALKAAGKNVYVVEPIPEMPENVPVALARSRLLYHRDAEIGVSTAAYAEKHETVLAAFDIARRQCGVRLLDPKSYLCGKVTCSGIRDGRPLYRDDNHLSVFGSGFLLPLFREALKENSK